MKKIIFLAVLLSVLMGSTLFPGDGQAYISHYITSTYEYCYLYLSNITEENIAVEVTLYKSDGTLLLDGGIFNGSNFSNYNENPSNGASVTFTIAPNQSGTLSIKSPSAVKQGYGMIKYSSDADEVPPALIGSMVIVHTNLSSMRSERTIAINNGLPF